MKTIRLLDDRWIAGVLAAAGSDVAVSDQLADELVSYGLGTLVEEVARPYDADTPVLVIGGDHPYRQWGMPRQPGLGQAYLDHGITPYLATNSSTTGGASPGNNDNLSWSEIAYLQKNGVEVVAHGHDHVQAWERQNIGVRIQYGGPNATATVHIQTSGANGVLTLTDSGSTAITLTGKTLLQVKAEVEAVAGWTFTVAEVLTGSESANNLLRLVSARTIRTGGNAVTTATYFACSGGIQIAYTGTSYTHVYLRRRDTNALEIYGDGQRLSSLDLTGAANDTLAELAAVIGALSGFSCKVFDNNRAAEVTAINYLQGDELSTNLVETRYVEVGSRPGNLQAGLPLWYVVERQFVKCQEVAAQNGVVLRDYAQSGGEIHPWTLNGHHSYGFHRIESFLRSYAPKAVPLATPVNWMPHKNTAPRDDGTQPYSREALIAMVDALCASPGWCQNILIHSIIPDGTMEDRYPALAYAASDQDIYADDFFALLEHIKKKIAAGELEVWTHRQMLLRRMSKAPPRNLIFNAALKAITGSLILSSADLGRAMPGWAVLANNSHASACSVANGVFSITSTNAGPIDVLQTEVILQPGKTYEIGALVEIDGVHATPANSIVTVKLQSKRGTWGGVGDGVLDFRHGVALATSTAVTSRVAHMTSRVTVPNYPGPTPARAIGSVVITTLDLSTNKNVRIQIDSKTALDNIDCSAGAVNPAAVTPTEIATAINTALRNSSTYGLEYANVASVSGGKIVLTAPTAGRASDLVAGFTVVPSAATSASAFTSIFGNHTFAGHSALQALPAAGVYAFNLIFATGSGTTKISRPYVCEVTAEH